MNKLRDMLASMTRIKWIMSLLWAVTFGMLLTFVGVVSGLTSKAGAHEQQHWTFKISSKFGKKDPTKVQTSVPVSLLNDITNKTEIEAKQLFKESNSVSTTPKKDETGKVIPGKFLSKFEEAQKVWNDAKKAATDKHDKAIKAAAGDKTKIQTADDELATEIKAANIAYKLPLLKHLLISNENQSKKYTPITSVTNDANEIYQKTIAEALTLGTDSEVDSMSPLKATPEAKKATNGIAITGLLFFVSLTTAIFGTAIIKYNERKGGK